MFKIIIAFACILNGSIHVVAQSGSSVNRSCSVVCLDDHWIPESYNVGAKTMINYGSEGIISVHETNDEIGRRRKSVIARGCRILQHIPGLATIAMPANPHMRA